MDLADVAAQLYGLDPVEFVNARASRVKAARTAGRRDLAAQIAALRKPSLAGWVVNIAAREFPDDVGALLELGAALRIAQRTLSGGELRRLTAQRQQVVRALVRKAGEGAARHGHPVTEATLREVSQTLHAALADPIVAEQVRAGTLVSAITYSGFGAPGLAAVPDEGDTLGSVPLLDSPASGSPEKHTGAEHLAAAQNEVAMAQTVLGQARTAATAARNQLTAADADVARLRAELGHAEQARQFAYSADSAAAESLRAAEEAVAGARRLLTQLTGEDPHP